MKKLGNLIVIGLITSIIGFIFQIFGNGDYYYIGCLINLFSFIFLIIIISIQLIKSIFILKDNLLLLLFIVIFNLTNIFSFVLIFFIYVRFSGFDMLYYIITPIYLIELLIFILIYKRLLSYDSYIRFKRNIMTPWIYLAILVVFPLVTPAKDFFNIIIGDRFSMTYEQFTNQKYKLFIVSKDQYNLKKGSSIIMRGKTIGQITNINSFKKSYIFELSISYFFKIPYSSNLTIVNKMNMEKDEMILVIPSDIENKNYIENDTLYLGDYNVIDYILTIPEVKKSCDSANIKLK